MHDPPAYRATVAAGRLTLNDWVPALAHGGPVGNHFRERAAEEVAIADITLIRNGDDEREAIVRFLTHGDRREAEDALISWARLAGHRRIWLDDRVVETGDTLPELGSVAVTCPTCAVRWEEHNPEFRNYVRSQGMFPNWCPLCGGTLPQWSLASGTAQEHAKRTPPRPRARSGDARPSRRR